MSEQDWDTHSAVDLWKLEAERLAELVEAQRQIIAHLREENERLVRQNAFPNTLSHSR